ncbi:hypothetical protein KCP77_17695 [Salmonella enterica subsp. enterica]|nr:hypothetical protein KCP77_17695 [Salmonella enterica subsp. enterica]
MHVNTMFTGLSEICMACGRTPFVMSICREQRSSHHRRALRAVNPSGFRSIVMGSDSEQ